jgi:Sulfotransferase family
MALSLPTYRDEGGVTRRTTPKVLFLGGLGRSGSTLLSRLLNELPGVYAIGELVGLFRHGVMLNETCGCGHPFHECPFWGEVGMAACGGWNRLDLRRILDAQALLGRLGLVPHLSVGAVTAEERAAAGTYIGAHATVWSAIARVSQASLIVDESKHPSLAHLLRSTDADMRPLHLVRDSRGVAFSWSKVVRRPESRENVTFMNRFGPVVSARRWNAANLGMELLSTGGAGVLRLRYEDLARSPRAALRAIMGFTGLNSTAGDLGFIAENTVTLGNAHIVAGNPMRFTTGSMPLEPDEEWRSAMSHRDRATVSLLTAPLLQHYGYRIC